MIDIEPLGQKLVWNETPSLVSCDYTTWS